MVTIQINYKSGRQVEVEVEKLTATRNIQGDLTNVEWEGMTNMDPLYVNLAEIESIWQVKS